MANNNINNCNNINNNQINNTMEVKTMKQITNGTINFNADALNASIIASANKENCGPSGPLFFYFFGCGQAHSASRRGMSYA